MVRPHWRWRLAPLVAAAAFANGCGGPGDDAEPPAPVVSVGMGEVRRDTITAVVVLVGRLGPIPGGSAALSAPTDGIVAEVLVSLGQKVEIGRTLVRLESPELEAQASALRAQATAAERDADRQRRLLDDGIASRRQVEERTAVAASAVAAAKAAEALLTRTRIGSPLRGVVQRVLVQRGERVAAGQALVEVIDDSALDLVTSVPATELRSLRVGQPATVDPGDGTPPLSAQVSAIAPAVDSLANAAQVLIRIRHPGSSLRSGAAATALVRTGQRRDVLIVPDSALVLVGHQLHVFVVGPDSIARAHPVEVGVRFGGRAEVTGSLAAGDRVVTYGAYGLPDSTRVVAATRDSL